MKAILIVCFFLSTLIVTVRPFRKYYVTSPYEIPTLKKENRSLVNYDIYLSDCKKPYNLSFSWESTGLCPPDPHEEAHKYLLSPDMLQNLFHIGSLPGKEFFQVRIHWLLDLVKLRSQNFKVHYDFYHLDKLIHTLWKNHLKPGFELMGNPSNYFTDFENATQIYLWKNMIQSIAKRYINLYGINYVKKWNFETWNEPDHHDFDTLNFTVQGFLNYYDACSEGLKTADQRLRLGGPGGSCHIPSVGNSPLCWALLTHCTNGTNFFTGEKGVRINFISFHKKGNGSTSLIFDEEMETMIYIQKMYPRLSCIPFYNDEGDPLKNWARPEWWRADVTYAAMVVKLIVNHILLQDKYKHLKLLSSDNAFLSYFPNQFTQRTLLARFQINNTDPKFVEYIRKPVYTAFVLIGRMCPQVLKTEVLGRENNFGEAKSNFGVLASSCVIKRQISIILYNTANTQTNVTVVNIYLNINVLHPELADSMFIMYEMNNEKSNPYAVWKDIGSPAYPTLKQFSLVKNNEEPIIKGPYKMKSLFPWDIHLTMSNPGVTLIYICQRREYLRKMCINIYFRTKFIKTWALLSTQ